MITGIFHVGSGLGNQLHRYVATRVIALDNGYSWGMENPWNFKGTFMDIEMGLPSEGIKHHFEEAKIVNSQGVDIRRYDSRIKDIQDDTTIDGEFQSEQYFEHRLDEVRDWLKVEPLKMDKNLCVINFRGGEYKGVLELFLPMEYWQSAVGKMLEINPDMQFEVHTDDMEAARTFFPHFDIIHDIGLNWRSIRYAKYLILSNSSFAILPALLGDAKLILAPAFWAGRNVGYWKLPQNEYKRFTYL